MKSCLGTVWWLKTSWFSRKLVSFLVGGSPLLLYVGTSGISKSVTEVMYYAHKYVVFPKVKLLFVSNTYLCNTRNPTQPPRDW